MSEAKNPQSTNWDEGLLPPGVSQEDLEASFTESGRDGLDIYPPVHLGHYAQKFGNDLGGKVEALLVGALDPEQIERIGVIVATDIAMQILGNIIDFGYAQRVLEERAGLPLLESSVRFRGTVEDVSDFFKKD